MILASGDHHFDEHGRFEECVRVHRFIAEEVARQRPDVFLSAGDIYERASTPKERAVVAAWLTEIAETCPVVIAKGNHDRPLDCELLGRLRTRHPIVVEEACGVHHVGGAAIAVVAWPSRSSVAAMAGGELAGEALDDETRRELQHVLRGLGDELARHDGPRILLVHALINGARTSHGQLLRGGELNVGLEELGLAQADIVVAGHIHAAQAFEYGGVPILYTGAPFRTAFGECEEKSILAAEVRRGAATWRRIPTPAAPMELREGRFVDGVLDVAIPEHVEGAEVRLRYAVAADQREAAAREAEALAAALRARGAARVKLEPVVHAELRARAPEIALARGVAEKLRTLWEARSAGLEPERQERLLRCLAELEEAA
jgi:DNA repair exonuclease SbcCD nuclease subunit